MKKTLIIWGIISFILVLSLTFIGFNLTSKNKTYYDIEKELVISAKNYYAQYPYELPSSQTVITSTKLKNHNFYDSSNECNGYVIVKKKYVSHEYEAYIKCPAYSTKNYQESYNKDETY